MDPSSRSYPNGQDQNGSNPKVQQPKPQPLASKSGPASILVSNRQKGNPVLKNIRNVAWEYSDTPADFVLGATTCALFLSLKYHRLHPEYIYTRIRGLAGKFNLRILLTMVDIDNHEEPIRELSKTSLVNNVNIFLCWSASEAGRYLELFKSFENAAPTSIRAQQSTNYSDKLVEFITVPRSINRTDAVGLVSNFGSLKTAVNAHPEEIALVDGWGQKKVKRWYTTVREPFRVRKAAKRGAAQLVNVPSIARVASVNDRTEQTLEEPNVVELPVTSQRVESPLVNTLRFQKDLDGESPMTAQGNQAPAVEETATKEIHDSDLPEGISAALARLRNGNS